MIYLDNAATGGQKPDQVITAVTSALHTCANPGRSGHKLSLSCASLVHTCRHALNDFLGGYGYERVIFTKNCTEALNIALFGVLQEGDHVVTTCMEHNSVLRPLEFLKRQGKITYDVCPLDENGNVSAKDVASFLRKNTRMVVVTTASNVTGATPSIREIRAALPPDVLLLCDGAQGCGHLHIDMQALGIDLLTVAGHKGMLGIQGSGALLFSERVNPAPLLFGGTGSISVSLEMPDFYPDELEAGTISYPAVLSLLEGVRYLTVHKRRIFTRLDLLTKRLWSALQNMPDYQVYSMPNPCGIVAFAHKDLPSEQLASMLSDEYDIAVRGGLHCAPLMHEALGTLDSGLVRVSLSHFNNDREIDELLSALREIAKK